MILAGQLSTELLTATKWSEKDEKNEMTLQIKLCRNIGKYIVTRHVGRLKRMKLMKEEWLICRNNGLRSVRRRKQRHRRKQLSGPIIINKYALF
jgi:hypothetical protein